MGEASINAMSFFCESVREEVRGSETYVGVLPDRITAMDFPFTFPSIAIVTRITIPKDISFVNWRMELWWPGDAEAPSYMEMIPPIEEVAKTAEDSLLPMNAIMARVSANNVEIKESGLARMLIVTDDQTILSGQLEIQDGRKSAAPDQEA